MHLAITGRHIALTPALKTYAEEKFMAMLARLATDPDIAQSMHVDIEMVRETPHHRKGDIWKAAATLTLPHHRRPLYASVTHEDMYAAVDLLVEETEREMQTYKSRIRALVRRGARTVKRLLRFTPESTLPRHEREREE